MTELPKSQAQRLKLKKSNMTYDGTGIALKGGTIVLLASWLSRVELRNSFNRVYMAGFQLELVHGSIHVSSVIRFGQSLTPLGSELFATARLGSDIHKWCGRSQIIHRDIL